MGAARRPAGRPLPAGHILRVLVLGGTLAQRTYHFVTLLNAREAYFSVERAAFPRGEVLGVTPSPLVVLSSSDFDGASLSTSTSEATVGGRATVHVRHELVGSYACGEGEVSSCSVQSPSRERAVPHGVLLAEHEPGAWTFLRNATLTAARSPFPLFATDVHLVGL